MTDQFVDANKMVPITPPPELVEQWANASARTHRDNGTYAQHEFALATQAARWGADQELEACCAWLKDTNWDELREAADDLRADRRPKPQLADGEVAELVAWLRKTSSAAFMDGWPNEESINIDRAADLLERLSTPQPS